MKILFVHHNYPAQFHKLAELLAKEHEVYFLSLFRRRKDLEAKGVNWLQINSKHKDLTKLSINEMSLIFAEGQMHLKKQGMEADIIHGHANFGTINYSKDIFPSAKQTGFFEWMYTPETEKEIHYTSLKPDFSMRVQQRQCNIITLGALDMVDVAITATPWQKKQFPAPYLSKIQALHNGIDTDFFCPAQADSLDALPPHLAFLKTKPVVTYLARSLEPHRGFMTFYKAIPTILEQCPEAHIVIAGNSQTSYSISLPSGQTYLEYMQQHMPLDTQRVHILPMQDYPTYRALLHLSRVHVHLTVPFTTSWSLLESMSCGCTVVGSDTAPVQEMIRHEDSGLLADFHNAQDIANKVCFALKNHADLAPLRQKAREWVVQNYDEKNLLPRYSRSLLGDI